MKKSLLAVGFSLAIIFISYSLVSDGKSTKETANKEISVAACPTYHYHLSKLSNNGFQILKSSSTGQAISALERGEVEFVIAGRKLKPEEPKFKSLKIADGYSFLSSKELVIEEDEMTDFTFFTDFRTEKVVKDFPQLRGNLKEVEDVYSKLEKGIIITSFENTDYLQAEIVHIIDDQGKRVKESRRPTLYFNKKDEEAEKIINLIN